MASKDGATIAPAYDTPLWAGRHRRDEAAYWSVARRRTWLVTGGCGFIGSHLVDALLARGDAVRVIDNLSTGRRENLAVQADVVVADVADAAVVRLAMRGVDGCFHLAAIASVERGNSDWLGTHRSNLTGAITVFDAARGDKPIPVVYASSAAVYGDAAAPPLGEAAPARPLSAYGADKLGCELHARIARLVHDVPTLGLRFFNVFGPRQDPASPYSGVISIFCERLRARRDIVIHGDGEQMRDFVYVGDVVRALLLAMERLPEEAPVLNICTGRGTTVLDLARRIAAQCGSGLEAKHGPARRSDIRISLGDPRLAERYLGFTASTSLDDGLRCTLAPPHPRKLGAAAPRGPAARPVQPPPLSC